MPHSIKMPLHLGMLSQAACGTRCGLCRDPPTTLQNGNSNPPVIGTFLHTHLVSQGLEPCVHIRQSSILEVSNAGQVTTCLSQGDVHQDLKAGGIKLVMAKVSGAMVSTQIAACQQAGNQHRQGTCSSAEDDRKPEALPIAHNSYVNHPATGSPLPGSPPHPTCSLFSWRRRISSRRDLSPSYLWQL
jgi:hypothetical protein